MSTYKVHYKSKKVQHNILIVDADNENKVVENFKHDYEHVYGGNPANILRIHYTEKIK